jgi:hypothetical protein
MAQIDPEELFNLLLSSIHDEAAAALAADLPIATQKALSNIVSMSRYKMDVIPEAERLRSYPHSRSSGVRGQEGFN